MGLRAGEGVSGEWMGLGSRGQRGTILRPRGLICIMLVNYTLVWHFLLHSWKATRKVWRSLIPGLTFQGELEEGYLCSDVETPIDSNELCVTLDINHQ